MDFQPMSPEEMQRSMQFLLNHQAQFAADIARNEARWGERFDQLSGKTDQIAGALLGLTRIVGQLAAAQQRTDEQLRENAAAFTETDARLNIVIEMFERHLREDHGRPPS